MIKRFVAADAGVSFISESFAKDQVKAGEVKLLTVEGVDLWRELGLVYRRDRSLPPRRPGAHRYDPRHAQARRVCRSRRQLARERQRPRWRFFSATVAQTPPDRRSRVRSQCQTIPTPTKGHF